ncbi:VOC family protein [Hyphobacterium marinum]|uniref:VOC family protein n=1 Tax=Hyphobacterium marinum TaxID=3116574 RepID=A0ABU7LYW8_9PROT|nr:VOC family protein [Hyphobacterium sp. Y6023]MEE2566749.1 VOC family protein [Hyphobacterium sp. Y6023]
MAAEIPVRDLERAAAFYCGVLAFREQGHETENGRRVVLRLAKNGARMSLYEPGPTRPARDGKGTITLRVDDVRRMHRALKDQIPIEWGPVSYDDERREFAFHDPDGHLVLVQENPGGAPMLPDA